MVALARNPHRPSLILSQTVVCGGVDVYGDHVPDHIFLLMETQNDFGGESYFVDGEAVLERLRADPEAASLLPLLDTLVFDQTESEANGGLFQGRQSSGPIFSRRETGRLQWKRMLRRTDTQVGKAEAAERNPYDLGIIDGMVPRSCWAVTPETLALATKLGSSLSPVDVLEKLDLAIHAASVPCQPRFLLRSCPRVAWLGPCACAYRYVCAPCVSSQESVAAARIKLGKGEAVVVDNYRVLHSREAFGGNGERRLWRVWTWTKDSDGRPNGDAAPVSTPLDIHLEQTAAEEKSAK